MKPPSRHAADAVAGAIALAFCLAAAAQAPGVRLPPPPALASALQPVPAPGAALKPAPAVNCGTFWTGWFKPIDPKTNPCPAGCEPAEKLLEKRHLQDGETWIDAQYRCTGVAGARAAGLEGKPVRDARLPSQVVGTLSPETGPWHSRVIVAGPGFGKAERVGVVWYPNDDESQPPAGSTSATLRQRLGSDQVEIEMPSGAGGAMGAVVRVLVFLPGQLKPVLAGRFTVGDKPAEAAVVTQVVDTAPLVLTGRRFETRTVETAALALAGRRFESRTVDTAPLALSGRRFEVKTVDTPTLALTGRRFGPVMVDTPALQLHGRRP